LWPNRLIGDDFLPDDCGWETIMYKRPEIGLKKFPQWVKEGRRSPSGRHTFTTWKHWSKDDKLLPSGLLGPVTLRTEAPGTPYLKSFNTGPGSAFRTVERVDGGAFRVLIYGNSIALHGPKPDIGWTNNWGMAASAPEKDFAHLVVAGLEAKRGERADFRIRNIAALERNMRTNISTVVEIAADVAFAPDYVVLAIGENMPRANPANADAYTRLLVNIARPFAESAKRPKIVMRSPFGLTDAERACTERAAKEVGATFVDAKPLCKKENMAIGRFANRAVAGHPGDLGMRRIADLILSGL
jgi:alpha-galactosidase